VPVDVRTQIEIARDVRRLPGEELRSDMQRDALRALQAPLKVRAEGDLDVRGTLGVDRDAPVGFSAIRLSFELETDADEEQLAASPALSTTVAAA
jgi:hypothetical protein